ncbi:Fatty acyl-CoA reductase 2, chloroplastic [Linum perenne]
MNIVPSTSTSSKMEKGLGIESFLSGKTWLITGATGFLGKVYANGGRKGRVMEKAFNNGDTTLPTNNDTVLDVAAEIEFALNHLSRSSDQLKTLGLQRAKKFGWHDTYTFTKAMGEMMIGEHVSDSKVPVDMVVNAIIAAATRHASNPSFEATVNVYQVGSSVSNPMTLSELFMFYYVHFRSSPILVDGRPLRVTGPLDVCSSIEEFSSGLGLTAGRISGEKMRQVAVRMATLYKPYMSFMGRYDCSNTEKLMKMMSEEEKVEFGFDVTQIDWEHYIADIHIPGLRKHVMKERMLANVLHI